MERKDYKAVKHMNVRELEEYIHWVYQRGYEDGVRSVATQMVQLEKEQSE